ncbi:hypothetical protein EMCRGX_G016561 [Ephydatia muelleri]
MGGSKFRLGRVRKYTDQQKRKPVTLMVSIPRSLVSVQASTGLYMSPGVCPQLSLSLCSEEQPADDPNLTVSLPLSTFVNSHVRSLQQLTSRVSTLTVSLPWVITSHLQLILCRIEFSSDQQPILEVSLTVDATLQWTATVLHKILNPTTSIPLFHLPHSIKAAEDVYSLLRFFSEVKWYQSVPELLHTLDELKHRNRILTKYASRLKMKIEKAVEPELICLDDEVNGYIKDTTEKPQYLSNIAALPGSSFQRIFWMQQVEAAKKKKRGVHWHPLMIRWCLYLRHSATTSTYHGAILRSFMMLMFNLGIGIQIVPKLKLEHIQLSAFSKMRVDLAAQVCSESVSKALLKVCGEKAYELDSYLSKSFIEIFQYIFTLPDVESFLSQRLCQDSLEKFVGCQRQRRRVNDNPNVAEFVKNTQAIRVIGSFCQSPKYGNCRGSNSEQSEDVHVSLPKRRRIRGTKRLSANQELDDTLSGAIEWDPSNNNAGLLCRAISDMKHNKSHSLPTVSSEVAMQIGSTLLE